MKKSIKVGIITFHMAHNYGAMLQAYALCTKINELGASCQIIDYRLHDIYQWHVKHNLKELIQLNGLVLGCLKFIKRILTRYYTKDKKWLKFHKFMTKNMILSDKYLSKEQLYNLDYDIYISGSDQVWNEALTGGIKSEYFLDFAKNSAKKISYAASNGREYIPEAISEQIGNLLKNFNYISTRETGLTNYIKEKYGINAVTVLDPTLLLNKEYWAELANEPKYSNYILIYSFDVDQLIFEIAKNLARIRNLKIVKIGYTYDECIPEAIQLTDCGPREFLGLFKNASCVLTSSFHGTVFSLLFNKDFYCFPHPKYSSRTDSLLDMVDLEDRNITHKDDINKAKPIDYDNVNTKIQLEREKSIQFLIESIGGS